jgi:glycosyltransferase involved in cell wall biosynthesis
MAWQYLYGGFPKEATMRYSVLLPTHNRLEYLRYAVETVRRQDFSDWEIIVSDNDSVDDIAGFVRSLGDIRVKYFRTESFLPVTDNWNNALVRSSGDYVVMLGDDDGLMPAYFSTIERLLAKFPDPDFVYASAYFYAYPGVMPDTPDGFLRRDRSPKLLAEKPYWLAADRAREIAVGYLNFRMPVASNMQFSLISRRKISEMSVDGPFFRSPYPDFYSTPRLFLTSSRILICPSPLVVIGITPKSYGYFHFNNRAADGVKFLNNESSLYGDAPGKSILLPGTSYYDSWLLAAKALYESMGSEAGLRPNYRRYRFLQIVHVYKRFYLDHTLSIEALQRLRQLMHPWEHLVYGLGLSLVFKIIDLVPKQAAQRIIGLLRSLIGQHAISVEQGVAARFGNLLEVYESFDTRKAVP